MSKNTDIKYIVNLRFEEINLPPFQDILILGKNSQYGKIGIFRSFELLIPNGFEIIEIDDGKVEAVFINKRILKKISKEKILCLLSEKVFPFISDGELLKVSFEVAISYSNIEIK